MQTLRKILKPVASLRLTVVLLAIAMVVIFAGTLAQRESGIWQVQRQFFHSWISWIALKDLVFARVPGAIPFVGGYTLIALLLVNLLAAHFTRFKLRWNRTGVILTHLGLIMLLVGEVVTSIAATEGNMTLKRGDALNYTQDIRDYELAIVDASPADHEAVTVIPASMIRKSGTTIRDPRLPFDVKVDDFYGNSDVLGPFQPGKADPRVNAGTEVGRKIEPIAKFKGAGPDAAKVDVPEAILTLERDGKSLGTYSFSFWAAGPQKIKLPDGKSYGVELRYKRLYKPYTVELLKFTHEIFAGSDIDKNFASRVRLVDPSRGVDREELIWMNHPLRYAGETFYQQSFGQDDNHNDNGYTTLQVVHNPGRLIPYLALGIAIVGLIVQFGTHLVSFLRARVKLRQREREERLSGLANPENTPARSARRGGSQLPPVRQPANAPFEIVFNFLAPAIVALACASVVLYAARPASQPAAQNFDLYRFGTLPVNFKVRTMPLDTLARVALKIIHGSESVTRDGQSIKPTQWLLDVIARPETGDKYESFRIDNPDVLSSIGLEAGRKYFSFAELLDHKAQLQPQVDHVFHASQDGTLDDNDLTAKKTYELGKQLMLYVELRGLTSLLLVPPTHAGANWLPIADALKTFQASGSTDDSVRDFFSVLRAYGEGKPAEFNEQVGAYRDLLSHLPIDQSKVDFEAYLNHFDPFALCFVFYILAFVLAAISWTWLGFQRPIANAALAALIVTFAVHSFGLVSRIYISGRPPVTNLYSSAIFIAWAVVGLSIFLEVVFRNGIGTAVGSVIGFCSLQIAAALALEGDTMEQLRAVLNTNFWLWTHVPCVTLGYAATFLAGHLAVAMVFVGIVFAFIPSMRHEKNWRRTMGSMIYGIVCFALLFSFVGTILGGIWADQSWGRFWGWDPKENGAILIVLWNAVILHARWGGLVRERGMAALAIFGNIVTSWSWFGTNMLGVGLHSYGFMEKAFPVLLAFVGLQVVLIIIAALPIDTWIATALGNNPLLPTQQPGKPKQRATGSAAPVGAALHRRGEIG